MVPDSNNKLDEILELAKENNSMLHVMRRHQRWSSILRAVYLLMIVGVSLGSYYYIQPYIESAIKAYQSISNTAQSLSDTADKIPSGLQGLDFADFLK